MKRICGILTFFTFSGLLLPPITYFFFLIMYVSNAIRDKKKEKLNLFFFWWLQPLTSLFWKSVSLTDKKKQARTVMIYSESFIFFLICMHRRFILHILSIIPLTFNWSGNWPFPYGKNILGVYCAVLIIAFPIHFVCDFKNCGVKRMGRDVNQTTKKI